MARSDVLVNNGSKTGRRLGGVNGNAGRWTEYGSPAGAPIELGS